MPPRGKATAGFASLIESDSEPGFDSFEVVGSQSPRKSEHTMTAVKPRGRPPTNTNRITKPAQRGPRRTSGGTPKQALQEKSKNTSHNVSREEESDHTPEEISLKERNVALNQTRRGRSNPSAAGGAGLTVRPGRGRPPKNKPTPVEVTAETQKTDATGEGGVNAADEHHARTERDEALFHAAGPVEEGVYTVDGDEESLRQRLGELSKRYESLEARYKDLRDVGVKEAENNFEHLKQQSEENNAAANRLISELKAELTEKVSLSKQLETSEHKCERLQGKVTDLTNSLTAARSEIKNLSNKLAAARSAEANVKVPGSALKNHANRSGPPAEVIQAAQAKEDLYGDLTGLIIRGMKHEDGEDVFDCIQTGRNGTLHFKLGLEGGNGDNYEDVQYTYRPQLNEDRDGELMDMLPDFLVEEITFARPHASKFYTRIIKSLTERLEG